MRRADRPFVVDEKTGPGRDVRRSSAPGLHMHQTAEGLLRRQSLVFGFPHLHAPDNAGTHPRRPDPQGRGNRPSMSKSRHSSFVSMAILAISALSGKRKTCPRIVLRTICSTPPENNRGSSDYQFFRIILMGK
jgi:hypothetical protein